VEGFFYVVSSTSRFQSTEKIFLVVSQIAKRMTWFFLLDRFEFNIKKKSSNEVYQIFTPILNKYENKNNTEDAMRRWTEIRIFELLKVLNASPNRSNYTKESLKILMEKIFFHPAIDIGYIYTAEKIHMNTKFFNENSHLSEEAIALYVDALKLGKVRQVPDEIRETYFRMHRMSNKRGSGICTA